VSKRNSSSRSKWEVTKCRPAFCFAVLVAWIVSASAQSTDRETFRKTYPLCFEVFPDEATVEHKTCLELSARYPLAFGSDKDYVARTVRSHVEKRHRAGKAEEQLQAQRNRAASPDYTGLEFKGIELGSDMSVIEDTGRFSCRDPGNPIADRICTLNYDESETIAGAPVRVLALYYYSGKLESISISFEENQFLQITAALSEKYGQGKARSEAIQNRMGATFENKILLWRRGKATVEATRYSGTVDRSSVVFRSDFSMEEFARRRKSSIKGKAKDL